MAEGASEYVVQSVSSFTPLVGEPDPFRPGPGWHLGPGKQVPLKGFDSEEALAAAVLERLAPWFHIRREVSGRHPAGARCRIDAVLTPRAPRAWKRQDVALGVEFKALGSRANAGQRDLTGWMAQAIDYAHVEWQEFGRIPVFMCPDPFGESRPSDGRMPPLETFVDGMLGHYGLGFLALYEGTGLSLSMQGQHRVWSERYGVEHGRRWALRPRVGNRN